MNATPWLEAFQAPAEWRRLLAERGPRLATWALALALGVEAALILTDLAGAGRAPAAVGSAVPAGAAQLRPPLDVASITNSHLFGIAAPDKPSAQDAANAPQSNIPLVLTGIIAADRPESGLAILGASPQAGKVYAVGDAVPGGAKLHSVFADRVVIERDGHLESLMLPRQVLAGPPPPSAGALPVQSPVGDRVRRLINEQPGLLADVIRPQVSLRDGKAQGFRVYPGRMRLTFMKLGLRPGDLVTAINGTPLDDPARGEEILRTLSSSPEAHVTVVRNEQQQDLTLNVAQVMQEAESLGANPGAGEAAGAGPNGRPERAH